jgi:hypothetical protein
MSTLASSVSIIPFTSFSHVNHFPHVTSSSQFLCLPFHTRKSPHVTRLSRTALLTGNHFPHAMSSSRFLCPPFHTRKNLTRPVSRALSFADSIVAPRGLDYHGRPLMAGPSPVMHHVYYRIMAKIVVVLHLPITTKNGIPPMNFPRS